MITISTKMGDWTVNGINLIPSDEIYKKLQNAIETQSLSESSLQKLTGHLLPIQVNFPERSITFCNY